MAFSRGVCFGCASLQCPPSWTLGPRQWCYLTSRWWLVVPRGRGGDTPVASQPPLYLPPPSLHRQPIRDSRASMQSNGEMKRSGTHNQIHLYSFSFSLSTVSEWFLHIVFSVLCRLFLTHLKQPFLMKI